MKFGSWTYDGFMVRLFANNSSIIIFIFAHFEDKLTVPYTCAYLVEGFNVNNLISFQQLDLRHMNQLPTNNSIGIAMDLRQHLSSIIISNTKFIFISIFVSNTKVIFISIFIFNTQVVFISIHTSYLSQPSQPLVV